MPFGSWKSKQFSFVCSKRLPPRMGNSHLCFSLAHTNIYLPFELALHIYWGKVLKGWGVIIDYCKKNKKLKLKKHPFWCSMFIYTFTWIFNSTFRFFFNILIEFQCFVGIKILNYRVFKGICLEQIYYFFLKILSSLY